MALGSLLMQGTPVRMTGQDCQRGTFNQRHSVLIDIEYESRYMPLAHLAEGQARCEVYNSILSEAAVLASNTAIAATIPRHWCCGRRSSATSPTARRS